MENKNTELATTENNGLQIFDLTKTLPDLSSAEEFPVDLMADYWTPENPGEVKRVFFDKIATRMVKDQTSDDLIELECATFLEPQTDGTMKSVSNGSKRLVGALQSNQIKRGVPLAITYLGKKKNKSNTFQSDSWSVKILIVPTQQK